MFIWGNMVELVFGNDIWNFALTLKYLYILRMKGTSLKIYLNSLIWSDKKICKQKLKHDHIFLHDMNMLLICCELLYNYVKCPCKVDRRVRIQLACQ